jgi:hypothetical protein
MLAGSSRACAVAQDDGVLSSNCWLPMTDRNASRSASSLPGVAVKIAGGERPSLFGGLATYGSAFVGVAHWFGFALEVVGVEVVDVEPCA